MTFGKQGGQTDFSILKLFRHRFTFWKNRSVRLTASIPAVTHAKNIDKEGKLKWCSCLTKCLGNRSYSSSDRMTLQEIHGIVDGQTHLTCEYLSLVIVAALIASVGLRRNSATTVISSMLVSPLMGMYCNFCGLGRFQLCVFSIQHENSNQL